MKRPRTATPDEKLHSGDVETSLELGVGAFVIACLLRWLTW